MVGDMPKGSMAHPLLKGGKRRDFTASSSNTDTHITKSYSTALVRNTMNNLTLACIAGSFCTIHVPTSFAQSWRSNMCWPRRSSPIHR